jgi:hypothetical protein
MMQYELTLISSSLLPLRVRSGTDITPPLFLAVLKGDMVLVQMLIAKGADPNALGM